MSRCIIATSSMTYALKGQYLLEDFAISANVVRLDSRQTKKGCANGLAVSCGQLNNAINILQRGGVPISETIQIQ